MIATIDQMWVHIPTGEFYRIIDQGNDPQNGNVVVHQSLCDLRVVTKHYNDFHNGDFKLVKFNS